MGEYDYFYPHNSDQYAFYRIPKGLFTDRDLKTMTNGSKILYGLLLDRVDLSARNRWIDEANRIFIIYPREEICDHMGCAPKTATKLVVELEDRGLAERRIQGLGKPAVLYVKNFASRGQDSNYEICENCGEKYRKTNNHMKYCPDCRSEVRRRKKRQYEADRRAKKRV